MADVAEFERAVLCVFELQYADTPEAKEHAPLKQQAMAYCEQVKQSADGWRHNLGLLKASQRSEAHFYALQTLQDLVVLREGEGGAGLRSLLPEGARVELRVALLAWVQQLQHQQLLPRLAPFVLTKLAVVIALLVKADYPERWAPAFDELLMLLKGGAAGIELHARIFAAIDEEIVSCAVPGGAPEGAHNMVVKDAMRAGNCIKQAFDAWFSIIQTLQADNPELANSCLSTLQLYVPWVDVSFVFNDRFIPLFFGCLRVEQLREASAKCLLQLVTKGMEVGKKVQMLNQLRVLDVLHDLDLESEDDDEFEFVLQVAELANATWQELLESLMELESAQREAECQMCAALLNGSLPLVWRLLQHEDVDVSGAVLPVASAMLEALKQPGLEAHGFNVREHIPQLLPVLLKRMRFPEDLKLDGSDDQEEFAEADNYRKSIRKVWINTVRTCHGQALAFVCQALEALLPQFGTLPFRDHEAFLFLLHAFGEGCAGRLQQLLAAGSPFRDALIALHTAMLPMFDRLHEMVLLQFVELVVRYAKVLPSSAQVQGVLQALCGPNGIGHASATVRSQCAYYLLKLCQKLVSAIRPFTGAVVAAIKEQLAVANADPKAPRLSPLDQLNLLEVAGLLVGKLGDDDAMARFCGEVVSGQLAALQQAMGAAHMEPDGDTQGPVSQALARSIESVAQFSKGFKAVVAVQPEFAKFLDATAHLLTEHPRFYLVRKKSVFLLQRMAVILGEGILPYVPVVIAPLLANSRDADELREAIRWLNMLIIKFKARMGPVVEAIFLALIGRIFALMPSAVHDVAGSGSTFALTERLQLQKIYFSFIDHMVKHQCAHVLFADCNVAQLEQFLGTIRHGCIAADGFAPDLSVHKACFDIVRHLVLIWLAPSETPPPPVAIRSLFAEFAVQRVTDAMFRCATLPHFDLEDAEANAVMSSIAALQGAMVQALGASFLQYVHGVYLPSINCPPNLARDFAAQLQASATDKAKLLRNFRDFVAAMQQKQ